MSQKLTIHRNISMKKISTFTYNIARRSSFQGTAVWLFITSLFYIRYHQFFLTKDLVEFGDNGVNEIQINGAWNFVETLGNYSRWTFHHPGPAFYYLYAIGQGIFFNLTHIVASPLAAHYLTALLIHAMCLSFVLVTISRRLDLVAMIPIAVAAWALHILHTDLTPATIWPPNAVIGPLMVAVVAAALLAAGESWALLPLAIADGLLVHGHVAQPLFVGPLTLYGVGIGLLTRSLPRDRHTLAWFAGSALVGFGFLLPLALDAVGGNSSNASIIVQHLRTHGGVAHTFRRSLGYLLSFVVYQDDTEVVQGAADFSLTAYVIAHKAAISAFAVAVIGSHAWLFNRFRSHFILALFGATWLAIALTLVWGMRQDGPMFKFNGYLNSGLIFLIYVPAIALVAASLQSTMRPVTLAGTAAAAAAFFLLMQPAKIGQFAFPVADLDREIRHNVAEHGASGVVLDFKDQFWLEAAGLTEMLLRGQPIGARTDIPLGSFDRETLGPATQPSMTLGGQNTIRSRSTSRRRQEVKVRCHYPTTADYSFRAARARWP